MFSFRRIAVVTVSLHSDRNPETVSIPPNVTIWTLDVPLVLAYLRGPSPNLSLSKALLIKRFWEDCKFLTSLFFSHAFFWKLQLHFPNLKSNAILRTILSPQRLFWYTPPPPENYTQPEAVLWNCNCALVGLSSSQIRTSSRSDTLFLICILTADGILPRT